MDYKEKCEKIRSIWKDRLPYGLKKKELSLLHKHCKKWGVNLIDVIGVKQHGN